MGVSCDFAAEEVGDHCDEGQMTLAGIVFFFLMYLFVWIKSALPLWKCFQSEQKLITFVIGIKTLSIYFG